MKPLRYLKHTFRGHEIERVIVIEYRMIEGRLRPFSVATTTESGIANGEPFFEWRPHYSMWDFNHSNANHCFYFNESGMGGGLPYLSDESAIWVDWAFLKSRVKTPLTWPAESRKNYPKELKAFSPALLRAQGRRVLREPIRLGAKRGESNPFEEYDYGKVYSASEASCQYCSICDDHLPESDHICDHIWWCEKCSQFTGEGLYKSQQCECMNLQPIKTI